MTLLSDSGNSFFYSCELFLILWNLKIVVMVIKFRRRGLLAAFRGGLFNYMQRVVSQTWLQSLSALTEVVGEGWDQKIWSRCVIMLSCQFLRLFKSWEAKGQGGRMVICRSWGWHYKGQRLRMRKCTELVRINRLVESGICCKFKILHYLSVSLVFWFLSRWNRRFFKIWGFLDDIHWNFMSTLIFIAARFSIRRLRNRKIISLNFTLALNTTMNATYRLTSHFIIFILLLLQLFYLIHSRVRIFAFFWAVALIRSSIFFHFLIWSMPFSALTPLYSFWVLFFKGRSRSGWQQRRLWVLYY